MLKSRIGFVLIVTALPVAVACGALDGERLSVGSNAIEGEGGAEEAGATTPAAAMTSCTRRTTALPSTIFD